MATDLWTVIANAHDGTLATIKRDGRPQLSDVTYLAAEDAGARVIRISTRLGLAKSANLRRDPRASFHVRGPGGAGYAVAEATASFSEVSRDEHDATVEALVDLYRTIRGEHPDWDEYRQAMVQDERVILSLTVDRIYGWAP